MAARLVEGRVDHDTFRDSASTAVRALAAKCRWQPLEPNHFPAAFEAEIIATLIDGRNAHVRIDDVFGNASRPARQSDVIEKFRANARLSLSAEATADVQRVFLETERSLHDFSSAVARIDMRSSP